MTRDSFLYSLLKLLPCFLTAIILFGSYACERIPTSAHGQDIDYNNIYRLQQNSSLEEVYLKGYSHIYSSPDSALTYFNIIRSLYHAQMPEDEKLIYAKACNSIGYVYFFLFADYQTAYEYYLSALEVAEENHFKKILPETYFSIANVYASFGDNDLANQNYRKAFYGSIEQQDWDVTHSTFVNMTSEAIKNRTLSDFIPEIETFSQLEIPSKVILHDYYQEYLSCLKNLLLGDSIAALEGFDRMVRKVDVEDLSKRFTIFALLSKNLIYQQTGSFDSAIATAHRIDTIINNEAGFEDMQMNNYKDLSEAYRQIGDSARSYEYLGKSLHIREKLLDAQKFSGIHKAKTRFDIEKMNEQIKEVEKKRQVQNLVLLMVSTAGWIVVLLLIWVFSQNRSLRKKNLELYRINQDIIKRDSIEKRHKSLLDQERKDDLSHQIIQVMENSEEIFSPEFSLGKLASMVDSNQKYVSQVINEVYEKNFSDFLAEYRIKEACRRISNQQKYGNLTLEAIANSLGFRSRANFNTVFKRTTGLTPSEYRNISKNSPK